MDNYKIIKTISYKSFYSDLYICIDLTTGQKVFIKKFANYHKDTEAKILKQINHPNIANYVDFFENENSYFLVQSFIEGVTIEDYVKKNRKNINTLLTNTDIKNIIIELTRAITYLNEKKIYHMDIRPCNIIYNYIKQVKLIDFGCAITDKYKRKGSYFGVINHLPPEFLKESKYEKSDIWGIGIILFYLIYQYLPYTFGKDISIPINFEKLEEEYNIPEKENYNRIVFIKLLKYILNIDIEKRYSLQQIKAYLQNIK